MRPIRTGSTFWQQLVELNPLRAENQRLQEHIAQLEAALAQVEWGYPPTGNVKGTFIGPARCPACFTDWTPSGQHLPDCALCAALAALKEAHD